MCECMILGIILLLLGRVCEAIYGARVCVCVCVWKREAGGMEREPLAPVFDLRCCS